MNIFDYIHDPFLRRLAEKERSAIEERLQYWGLHNQSFAEKLDNWICNFDSLSDKRLALKVFHALKYYKSDEFTRRLKQLYDAIVRHMKDTKNDPSDIVLVTPDGVGDSADRHVYDLVKHWNLDRNQVYNVSELSRQIFRDPVFVLFNDTHGTGNQFLGNVWPTLKQYGEHKIYVLAIAISQEALRNFREVMPRVHVIPHIPVEDAWSMFTGEECVRLQQIGTKVYSKHPMGYGNAALLTAYYFQCPNNTLPIIWADGENNTVEGNSYNWSPLFSYRPKKKPAEGTRHTVQPVSTTHLTQGPDHKSETAPTKAKHQAFLRYRYRVGLIDLDLGLTNLPELATDLNDCQNFFHFTAPRNVDLNAAIAAITPFEGQRHLSVYEIGNAFFTQFDEFAVDVAGCFTRHPLAYVNRLDGTKKINYFSGLSNVDRRFLFVSANQLRQFTQAAGYSLEQGLTYIIVGQLVVYFTGIGYHKETKECPMDFCEVRAHMISGLKRREFCAHCNEGIKDEELLGALKELLHWSPM